MTTFLEFLAEGKKSTQKNFEKNKQFVIDNNLVKRNDDGEIVNLTQTINSKLNSYKNTLLSNGIEVDNIDDLDLYQLKEILDKNGLEAQKHLRIDRKNNNYKSDVDFVLRTEYGKSHAKDGDSTDKQIKLIRHKFLKALEASDKKMIDAEKKSLADIKSFFDANKIDPDATVRNLEWKKHEKDVCAGINNLFSKGFFKLVSKAKETVLKDNKNFKSEVIGGSNKSDVLVKHKDKEFYVECKLNLETSEYFKFGLKIHDNNITYDHKDFITTKQSDEEQQEINELFKKINISGFLNDLVRNKDMVDYWKQFNQNIKDIVKFLKNNEEYAEFVKKSNIGSSYPEAFQQMTKVFELYCDYYIDKYNELIDNLFDLIQDKKLKTQKDDYKIKRRSKSDDIKQSTVFSTLNNLQEKIAENNISISDKSQFNSTIDQIKKIEAKLTLLLEDIGKDPTNFNGLDDIKEDKRLMYFFKLFISSTGRKTKGSNKLIQGYDGEGNMQICPEVEVENSRLGQMITDFYVKKDNCAYIQIADTIYQLDKDFNPFNIDKLPIFKECFTRFAVKMLITDELDKISLHTRALEPDQKVLNKAQLLSFKEADKNYLIKKLKNIEIKIS